MCNHGYISDRASRLTVVHLSGYETRIKCTRKSTKGTMGFFDSEIVQQEAKQLFEDYQSLMRLGSDYGKFDREGKKIFIEQMEAMMERYRVFMKRFELSEDFMAQMTVEQLKTQLGQFGVTPQQMFDQMHLTLERMKAEVEKMS
jgi:hypothetical protein